MKRISVVMLFILLISYPCFAKRGVDTSWRPIEKNQINLNKHQGMKKKSASGIIHYHIIKSKKKVSGKNFEEFVITLFLILLLIFLLLISIIMVNAGDFGSFLKLSAVCIGLGLAFLLFKKLIQIAICLISIPFLAFILGL